MAPWKPDAIIEITLLPPEAGGRASAIPVGSWFSCPLCIGGLYFDVRLDLSGISEVAPNIKTIIPAKFLFSEQALALVKVGSEFTLWEGKTIATGKVISIGVST